MRAHRHVERYFIYLAGTVCAGIERCVVEVAVLSAPSGDSSPNNPHTNRRHSIATHFNHHTITHYHHHVRLRLGATRHCAARLSQLSQVIGRFRTHETASCAARSTLSQTLCLTRTSISFNLAATLQLHHAHLIPHRAQRNSASHQALASSPDDAEQVAILQYVSLTPRDSAPASFDSIDIHLSHSAARR